MVIDARVQDRPVLVDKAEVFSILRPSQTWKLIGNLVNLGESRMYAAAVHHTAGDHQRLK